MNKFCYSACFKHFLNQAAILIFLFVLSSQSGIAGNVDDGRSVQKLTGEQLIQEFSFFHGDSLNNFDFNKAYHLALQEEHISIFSELRSYFYIKEEAFVKDKYGSKQFQFEPEKASKHFSDNRFVNPACDNLDFENGDYTGWTGTIGYNTNSGGPITVTGAGIFTLGTDQPVTGCSFHTLISSAYPNDLYGNFPGIDPGGGNYTERLGGSRINQNQTYCSNSPNSTYSAAESIEQTFIVTPSNSMVTYNYAVVLNDGGHAVGEQPYFRVEVFDQFGNLLPGCIQYYQETTNGIPPPGYFLSALQGYNSSAVFYIPWTANSIYLTPYLGQQVTIRFTASGCTFGRHFAYAYIDANCGPASIVNNAVLPCGGNGTDTLTAPPVVGGTYSWSGPGIVGSSTGQSITVNTVGVYTVDISPASGCPYTLTATVTASPGVTAAVGPLINVSCFGAGNGSATVNPSGGTPAYTYLWNPGGQTTQTANNLAQGTYTVTITDASGCTYEIPVAITEPSTALNASLLSLSNVDCFGNTNGRVTVSGSGGTPSYTYSLDGGPFSSSGIFSGLAPGSYIVTVLDANGCTYDVPFAINQPPLLNASITSQTNVDCFGNSSGSVTVTGSGGTPSYTYSINGGPYSANGTFTGLAQGAYTVTVLDANGCTYDVPFAINQPPLLNASITSQTNVDCFGNSSGSVTITGSGGTPSYTYSINGGPYSANGTFTGLAQGAYTVAVLDANGCTYDVPITITQPSAVSASIISLTNVDCFGNSSGNVTMSGSGGSPSYTYSINGGPYSANGTFTGLAQGAYTVAVLDANGCTYDVPFIITQPPPVSASITSQTDVDCFGNSSGSVTVTGSGGTPSYTYSINGGPYSTNGTFTGLAQGAYTVTVLDANGCTYDVQATITGPSSALNASVTSQSNVDCFGNSNGSVTVTGNGGSPSYTYSLNGGPFVANGTFTGLAQGTYTVTVRDANGCTYDVSVTITQPSSVVSGSITSQTNVDCSGNANGIVTVSGNGGTPSYTYSLNGGPFVANGTFTGLAQGTYTVTVRDANGCTYDVPVTIVQTPLIIASIISQVNVNCFGSSSGSVVIAGSGGTPSYTYSINGGPFVTSGTFSGLSQGSYTVTVHDANGCGSIISISITEPSQLIVSSIFSPILCNGDLSTVTISATGGIPSYVGTGTFTQAAGTTSYLISDANGCDTSIAVSIIEPPSLSVSTNTSVSNNCNNGYNGIAAVNAIGGTGNYTYVWTPTGGTTSTASNLTAGTYSVLVTDENGCSIPNTVAVASYSTVQAEALSNDTGICISVFTTYNLQANNPLPGVGVWSISNNHGNPNGIANPYSQSTEYTNPVVGDNVLLWTVTNGPCVSQDSVVLKVKNEVDCLGIDIPNGFTPNGDSYNDSYIIQGIESYPENTFLVFNRWGNEVFHKENYKNNGASADWYGQNNYGEPLPDGTYYVILTIKDNSLKWNTYVDLRR